MLLSFDTATVISLIVSIVIPLFSALLFRAHWPVTVIGLLTLALSFANAFFTQWADTGDRFDWRHALLLTVADFIVAVAGHKGIWKATPLESNLIQFPARTAPPAQAAA